MDKRLDYLDYSDILKKNIEIVKEKGKQHGNTYQLFGDVMMALFPNGIHLNNKRSMKIYGIFHMIIHKVIRLSKKLFHKDLSLDNLTDLCNYAAMLEKIIMMERKDEDND
jgi:hypothetical protein